MNKNISEENHKTRLEDIEYFWNHDSSIYDYNCQEIRMIGRQDINLLLEIIKETNIKYDKIIASLENDEEYPTYDKFGRRVEEIIEEDFHD
jgi:hypothetical protein